MREREVEAREIEGPARLAPVQLFGRHEVLQVLVVRQYLTGVFSAFNKVPPLLQCPDDSKHLLVVYFIVAFDQRQQLGEERNWVPLLIFCGCLGEDSTGSEVGAVSFDAERLRQVSTCH